MTETQKQNRRGFLKGVALTATTLGSNSRSGAQTHGVSKSRLAGTDDSVLHEKPRRTPVVHDCDICVVGGSCTGVFAAVRAARLGARVALIENNGFFGGVATAALVNVWHSIYDTTGMQQIIGGLTVELIERLRKRKAATLSAKTDASRYATFNSAEMIIELDRLISEHPSIRPFLHTRFVDGVAEAGSMSHAIVEDKTGRRAIRARYFIDATGDGDLVTRIGLSVRRDEVLQPPTMCAIFHGLERVQKANPGFNLAQAIYNPQHPNALKHGFVWTSPQPGLSDVRMVAGTRVRHADCSDADQLTHAEMDGRRQVRAIHDILRTHYREGEKLTLGSLSTRIGVRETRHAVCLHRLSETEVLQGKRFDDAIANGCYRVDVHHGDREGLTFRYLDGREVYVVPGKERINRRWRSPQEVDPTFYQVPYRSLVPRGAKNVLVAGRLLDADRGAFGGVRVMVNCNQMGEAAGTACCLAMQDQQTVDRVDAKTLRKTLAGEGSVMI